MAKKLLAALLAWTILFVPLSRVGIAQQGNPSQQGQKDKQKKGEKKGIFDKAKSGLGKAAKKTADVAKDPEKTVNDIKTWAAGGRRQWTEEQKRQADEAQALFSVQDSRQIDVSSVADASGIYNPNNAAASQAMVARVKAVRLKYQGRRRLTRSQAQEVANAVLPFARAADSLHLSSTYFRPTNLKPAADGAITIPAHTEVLLGIRVNCQDLSMAAPQPGEKMHLVRESTLLPDEFLPIYTKLVTYSQGHPEAQRQVQRIVWNMRHGCFRDWDQGKALRLQPADNALLDSLLPGASKIISDKCRKFNFADFSKDVLAASLDGGARIDVNPAGLVDADQTVARVVNAHAHFPITEPIPDDNSDFSLLQPGVAVQSHHGNAGAIGSEIAIRNTTDQPATFTPAEWELESRRPTQRLAIVGIDKAVALIIAGVIVAAIVAGVLDLWPLLAFAVEEGLLAEDSLIARFLRGAEVGGEAAEGGAEAEAANLGETAPANLKEKLAIDAAKADPTKGKTLEDVIMNDPRWKGSDGWVKMAQNINGVEVHYVRNTITGAVDNFKIVRLPK